MYPLRLNTNQFISSASQLLRDARNFGRSINFSSFTQAAQRALFQRPENEEARAINPSRLSFEHEQHPPMAAQEVFDMVASEEPTAEQVMAEIPPDDPAALQHLFLTESLKFLNGFIDELKKECSETAQEELDLLRNQAFNQIIDLGNGTGLYSSDFLKPLTEELLLQLKGSAEVRRQDKVSKILSQLMYDALALVQKSGELSDGDVASLHWKACLSLAKAREAELKTNSDGKIVFSFSGEWQNAHQEIFTSNNRLEQLGKFVSSLERRGVDKGAINQQLDSITLSVSPQKQFCSAEWRSGSFDYQDVKPGDHLYVQATPYAVAPHDSGALLNSTAIQANACKQDPSDQNLTILAEHIKTLEIIAKSHPAVNVAVTTHKKSFRELAEKRLIDKMYQRAGESEALSHQSTRQLIAKATLCRQRAIAAPLEDNDHQGQKGMEFHILRFGRYIKALEAKLESYEKGERNNPIHHALLKRNVAKYRAEFREMVLNTVIIEKNAAAIEGNFEQVWPDFDRMGMSMPAAVKRAFNDDSSSPQVAMISLQTPVNMRKKGINKLIHYLASKDIKKGPLKWLKSAIGPDISELDPVYREMKGFEEACINYQHVANEGLYINLATNAMGKKPINGPRLFNRGTVDKAKHAAVKASNVKAFKAIQELTKQRIRSLDTAIDRASGKDKVELEQYRQQIVALHQQVFDSQGHLRPDPNTEAVYEIPARLNTLMKMCGIKTTFHCRSGNNRTAALAAKSHQIATVIASGEVVPEPTVMAGTLGNRSKGVTDHWSAPLYLHSYKSSLHLQKANKGTRGTKVKVKELRGKGARRLFTEGAFSLAQRFDPGKLEKAKRRHAYRF